MRYQVRSACMLVLVVLLLLAFPGISKAFFKTAVGEPLIVEEIPSAEPTPIQSTIPEPYLEYEPVESEEPIEPEEQLEGPELYRSYISQIHEQYYPDVDPYIALAVMEIESDYQPDVESVCGAVGLMQVIPKYHASRAAKYGLEDIWDPYTNIIAGMDLLNELYHNTGSWAEALFGYNRSRVYVNVVLARAETLKECGYFG